MPPSSWFVYGVFYYKVGVGPWAGRGGSFRLIRAGKFGMFLIEINWFILGPFLKKKKAPCLMLGQSTFWDLCGSIV